MEQSNTWQGRWTTCTVTDATRDDNKALCAYWCKSAGYREELQMIKVTRAPEELEWELCHINLTSNSDGENNIGDRYFLYYLFHFLHIPCLEIYSL